MPGYLIKYIDWQLVYRDGLEAVVDFSPRWIGGQHVFDASASTAQQFLAEQICRRLDVLRLLRVADVIQAFSQAHPVRGHAAQHSEGKLEHARPLRGLDYVTDALHLHQRLHVHLAKFQDALAQGGKREGRDGVVGGVDQNGEALFAEGEQRGWQLRMLVQNVALANSQDHDWPRLKNAPVPLDDSLRVRLRGNPADVGANHSAVHARDDGFSRHARRHLNDNDPKLAANHRVHDG